MTESSIDTCHFQIQGLALSCDVWHAGSAVLIGPMAIIQQGKWDEIESYRVFTLHLTQSSYLLAFFSFIFYNDVVK